MRTPKLPKRPRVATAAIFNRRLQKLPGQTENQAWGYLVPGPLMVLWLGGRTIAMDVEGHISTQASRGWNKKANGEKYKAKQLIRGRDPEQ